MMCANSLDKVVPQHARRVLEHSHKRRHVNLVLLYRRYRLTLLNGLQLPQISKAGESPIALFGDESVVGV